MRYILLALGLGQMALAQTTNSTTMTWSPTSTPTSAPTTVPTPFPPELNGFQFYGCVASDTQFPTFEEVASSGDMTIELCSAACPSRLFGVYNTKCYCGDEINGEDTGRVENEQCNTECPGNPDQFCGGTAGSLRLARRQAVSLSVYLTVYIRVSGDSPTVTETITSRSTVTECPEGDDSCVIGQPTTTTVTTTYCPEPTPTDDSKIIVCYGDWCASPHPCHGDHCPKHRVVCQEDVCHPEECSANDHHPMKRVECHGEECHYPECHGEECHKKVVCYGEHCINQKCYGDECHKKIVCHGDECGHQPCHGEDCYIKEICEGEECQPEPPCGPDTCPVPPPPAPPAPCPPGGCPVPPPSPPAPCPPGQECPAPTPAPPSPCPGPGCPTPTGSPMPPNTPVPPPVGGAGQVAPAFGLGAIAGLAFFL